MTTHRRPCTGCRCPRRAGPRWDSPGAPPCPAPRTRCSSGRWGVSSEVSVQRIEVTVPGEGGQGRALQLRDLHREAGGEAVLGPDIVDNIHSDIADSIHLGHAGVGVAVLQLGVDDAQPVVGVAEAGVHNPTCNIILQYITLQHSTVHNRPCNSATFCNTFACIEIIAVAILYFCTATSYSYTNVAPPRIAFRKKEYKLHWCAKMVNV